MTESEIYKHLEIQKKFDEDVNVQKIMKEYQCTHCGSISKNLEIYKEIFDKEIYKEVKKLQKIVDEHNKELSNQTLMQKLGMSEKDKKWTIGCNIHLGDIYIREEESVTYILHNKPIIKTPVFKTCYVICPSCKQKYSFRYGDLNV